ncbi:MAG: rhomboid family intramembrane serine protease [Bacteroidota bacterium]
MQITKKASASFRVAAWLVIILWVVHLFQYFSGIDLGFLGTYPREVWGLKGIIASPFIHADFPHLMSNSVPIFVLTSTIFFFFRKVATRAYLMIYLLTGLMVWIFARTVFHIGASGVVYGLVSFIFWNGIFRQSLQSIVLALVVTVLYSGYFAGILPNQEGISWESHLLGGLVGIFVAYYFKSELEADEYEKVPSWELEQDSGETNFLRPDTFEKTKEERLREQQAQRDYPDWYSNSTYDG